MKNLLTRSEAAKLCAAEKEKGRRVVFTNGCFDIIHAGHVRYLTEARERGDLLVVGLNSDGSVRRLKGSARPVNEERDRAEVLLGLKAVDYVTIFAEDTAAETIAALKPSVYAKGADYTRETLPEAELVEDYGGEVAFIDLAPGRSTSGIIARASAGQSGAGEQP